MASVQQQQQQQQMMMMPPILLLCCFFFLFSASAAAASQVYKVGGSVGWTILGSPNYTAWASTVKAFHVGDTLLFEYNNKFHNVMEVSMADYGGCNASSPMATYTTGNDSIPLKLAGHHYFLCGFPGHCEAGQKVDILVMNTHSPSSSFFMPPSAAPPAMSPSPSSLPPGQASGPGFVPASAPKPSGAAATTAKGRIRFMGSVLMAAAAAAAAAGIISGF